VKKPEDITPTLTLKLRTSYLGSPAPEAAAIWDATREIGASSKYQKRDIIFNKSRSHLPTPVWSQAISQSPETIATPRPVSRLNHQFNLLSLGPTSSKRRGQQPLLFRSSKGYMVVEVFDFKDVVFDEIYAYVSSVIPQTPQTTKRCFIIRPIKQFKSPDNGSQTTSTAGLVFV
jgi:hypothetical protein